MGIEVNSDALITLFSNHPTQVDILGNGHQIYQTLFRPNRLILEPLRKQEMRD